MQKTDSAPRDKDVTQRRSERSSPLRAPGSPGRRTDGPMGYGPRLPADPGDPEPHILRGED